VIPLPTIALVITTVGDYMLTYFPLLISVQLKVCLDEWADGSGHNIDFSMGVYERVYNTALKFLTKASESDKYKDYMLSLRERWFKIGRSAFHSTY
jgi:hypothetical protein